MTVLGEFVLPGPEPVWTATLVGALALFDVEEKAARQALARTAAEGWLRAERIGRRARWSLSARGRQLLSEGAERIYAFGVGSATWDGQWLMLLASVPESRRDLRHRLRTRLSWSGFGSPAPGVWVSPDTSREAEARRIIGELELDSEAMSFVARCGSIGEANAMVGKAWQLAELAGRYADFIEEFIGLLPADGEEVMVAQTRLVHAWRRFPFLDPALPEELLPEQWSGTAAAKVFHDKHADWRAGAQRHWASLLQR
ncbi:MAG: PaaX family transcriptional regulator [Sciscionella sp.]